MEIQNVRASLQKNYAAIMTHRDIAMATANGISACANGALIAKNPDVFLSVIVNGSLIVLNVATGISLAKRYYQKIPAQDHS